MRLKNDVDGRNQLRETIEKYYEINGGRPASRFLESRNEEWAWSYQHYLVDRKHVVRYGIGEDRNIPIGALALAIGPHYFDASDFWDYPNSERFKMDATTEAVEHNLRLLDEFLGYPVPKPPHG